MLAMQYSFTLPADFDMAVIRRRIVAKGPLTDSLPGLGFKAYLYARRGEHGPENLYAPFYLWNDDEGMNQFLAGEIFTGLTQSFGWPSVKTWSVLQATTTPALRDTRYLSREILPITPHTSLAQLRQAETDIAQSALTRGALAVVTAFEPTNWTLIRARLWRERPPETAGPSGQIYNVGYLAARQS
jgi:hypothetical protein